jgi:hypothetical protein
MGITSMHRIVPALTGALVLAACAPKAPPLRGTIAPARLPATELPPVHRQLTFQWSYSDQDLRARGDGAARVAPPDSVRLDLFVGNAMGGGHAILIDDQLATSGNDAIKKYLPPIPLLWAALGRLRVPEAADTVARVDGDTLRVEIGQDPGWRATFVGNVLRRLELIDGGRIPQWLSRDPGGHIQYEYARAQRRLELTIVRVDTVSAFDAAIWR